MDACDDTSPEAKKWRQEQMVANLEISGFEVDRKLLALVDQWEQEEGLSQDEVATRLVVMLKPKA
jgi:hypothetical protein